MSDGTERCWDHEDCPRDGCEGELQQQDRFNVMCLKCERVFTHQKDDDEHRLIHDCEFVARKPRAMTDGGTEQTDIERFIERNREALEGNPTEYARGYETCLDRLEELVEDDGLSGDGSGELGMDHYRDIQEDERFELNGTEWHVQRIHDEFGSNCDYSRMIEAYDPGGVCQRFVVYPTEVRRMTDFVSMNRGEYEVVAERPQQTLVPDGGYETVTITDEFVRANASPSQEADCWCHAEADDGDSYWFPCRLDPGDVDGRDAVPDPDVLPGDAVLQYPLESREPQVAGGAMPPEHVRNRVVE